MSGDSTFNFFGSHWVGEQIDFHDGQDQVMWTLGAKLSERHARVDSEAWVSQRAPSTAWALFECHETAHPSNVGIMKIYMQVPYEGSEGELPEIRGQQASMGELHHYASNELTALQTLSKKPCKSTPTLLLSKLVEQDDSGWVPGGFVLYLLMEKLLGTRLTEDIFWALPKGERSLVRDQFKTAYKDCVNSGIKNYERNIDNLLWSKHLGKVFITGFQLSSSRTEGAVWKDAYWIGWGLATAPSNVLIYKEGVPPLTCPPGDSD